MGRVILTTDTSPMTTGEVAKAVHVHLRTVLDWIQKKKLKAYRTPGNHCRIEWKDFLAFCRRYKMPIPKEVVRRGH